MLDDAVAWTARNSRRRLVTDPASGHVREFLDPPAVAVRELISNALVHRDLAEWSTSRALWERRWFQIIVAGRGEWPDIEADPAEDFVVNDDDTVVHWLGRYAAEISVSQQITQEMSLDDRCARHDLVDENLRWVLLHLIEETARHAGHADIIREALDGTQGM